jgi:hypothetical protein
MAFTETAATQSFDKPLLNGIAYVFGCFATPI